MSKLRIATAQFPVSGHIGQNYKRMADLVAQAKKGKADVVHFSETALSGYAGTDFKSWDGYDFAAITAASKSLADLAKQAKTAIVYGTNHRAGKGDIRNRLVYLNKQGKQEAYYDKRFCTPGDMDYYTPGRRFATFDLNGFTCSLLICFDVRFPELYRELKKRNVQVIFQSFYNARQKGATIHLEIMRQSMQVRAATNYFYISGNNSSAHYQGWPSVFIHPDGRIARSCRQHRTDIIFSNIDSEDTFYDASWGMRERAMKGFLFSG